MKDFKAKVPTARMNLKGVTHRLRVTRNHVQYNKKLIFLAVIITIFSTISGYYLGGILGTLVGFIFGLVSDLILYLGLVKIKEIETS